MEKKKGFRCARNQSCLLHHPGAGKAEENPAVTRPLQYQGTRMMFYACGERSKGGWLCRETGYPTIGTENWVGPVDGRIYMWIWRSCAHILLMSSSRFPNLL